MFSYSLMVDIHYLNRNSVNKLSVSTVATNYQAMLRLIRGTSLPKDLDIHRLLVRDPIKVLNLSPYDFMI